MDSPIVDLHLHLFPERMFVAIWDYFAGRDWGVHREQVPTIIDTLTHHGVSLATGLSYPHKQGVARPLNRFMAEMDRAHDIFYPFGSIFIDDEDYAESVDEVFDSPHLHGFKFQPLVQRFDLNHPRLDYLYERCEAEGFPLLIHAGLSPKPNDFLGLAHFSKLLRRYPEIRVCVAHMGAPEFDGFLRLCADHPGLFLDTAMINTETDLFDNVWRGNAELLCRHADRICFGSDWPNVPYAYQEALDSVARYPLPAEARAGVLGLNAMRFLQLPVER